MQEQDLAKLCEEHFHTQSPEHHYLNEASVQLKLGIEIFKKYQIDPEMEYTITSQRRLRRKEFLDIRFALGETMYGIELKYKTKAIEGFHYTDQGAQNDGKYDFLNDVQRLETFKRRGLIHKGFALFLTNDQIYWKPAREHTAVKRFDLIDGITTRSAYYPRWSSRRRRITLAHHYDINWYHTDEPEAEAASHFAFCIVQV